MKRVIVSRHPATAAFIRRELPAFADAPALESVSMADIADTAVAGNLPLDLAASAAVVFAVVFPTGNAPRGQDYTLADMDRAGARIRAFEVDDADLGGLGWDPWRVAEDPTYLPE